ncbi:MAG: cell filamentation protein Fic [Spirochaetae bacterium HGW-Spirochaetae-1]|jgi:Fic family protein|nr:MAG: cell filamentation protein Fic [Spirochaetae bacterium HGW-Spirochaetae-1]
MNELLKKIDKLQKQIDDMRPLNRETVLSLKEYYRIGLTWSSNALEGNTLTESETKVVIEDGLTIGGKPLRDHLEARGHAEAFSHMLGLVDSRTITEDDILMLHRLFYRSIDDAGAGVYRKSQVVISGSQYPLPAPDRIPELMREFTGKTASMRKTDHPVVTAARTHLDFVFIHPFVDGNGRVARLLMNLVLLQEGYTIALISPVVRAAYISSIESARENDADFINLVCRSVYETQKDYIRMMNL